MDSVKNINSDNSNKKTTSTILSIFQSLSIIFIGVIIVNFIVKW